MTTPFCAVTSISLAWTTGSFNNAVLTRTVRVASSVAGAILGVIPPQATANTQKTIAT
jgi:hypothetical protein